jgi:hypothetical protein
MDSILNLIPCAVTVTLLSWFLYKAFFKKELSV